MPIGHEHHLLVDEERGQLLLREQVLLGEYDLSHA
jgi:hypothetical protein